MARTALCLFAIVALAPGFELRADAGPAPPPAALEVRFVSFAGKGVELRLVARRLRNAEVAMQACALASASARGSLAIDVTLVRAGTVAAASAHGSAAALLGECAVQAIRAITFDPLVASSGTFSATAIIRRGVDETQLPELASGEALAVQSDATCEGVQSFPCAPHKSCRAAETRKVRCPEAHGVPERKPLADKRLVVAVSGGKTGQLGEELTLVEGPDQCVLIVHLRIGGGPMDGANEQREEVDIPCARARAAMKTAAALTLHRTARATRPAVHEVTRQWALWKPGKRAPKVVTGTWTGIAPRADAAFSKAGDALAALARDFAKLQPGRFGP